MAGASAWACALNHRHAQASFSRFGRALAAASWRRRMSGIHPHLDGAWPAAGKEPLGLSGSGLWQIARATWHETSKDNLGLIASGVAFMVFLSLVPLLVVVVLTYGLVASPERVAGDIVALSKAMPEAATSIIANQLRTIVALARSTAGFGLLVALLISVYGAMSAASGMITALNIVFGIRETRSLPQVTLLTLAITVGL
ncbi:MAG TPA: YhjD/YihY/BrkB family envelope integrity protein, partial [Rhizomicrobium sp.]|nr:YhjD/YihY/BrkB family envelope integrity protein [Rhizomicrobium sp.]